MTKVCKKVSEDIRGIKTYSEAANPEREQRQPSITGRTNPVAAGSIQRKLRFDGLPEANPTAKWSERLDHDHNNVTGVLEHLGVTCGIEDISRLGEAEGKRR